MHVPAVLLLAASCVLPAAAADAREGATAPCPARHEAVLEGHWRLHAPGGFRLQAFHLDAEVDGRREFLGFDGAGEAVDIVGEWRLQDCALHVFEDGRLLYRLPVRALGAGLLELWDPVDGRPRRYSGP